MVALYGGGFSIPPSFFHWLDYTLMANLTGATIEVPIYPLVQRNWSGAKRPVLLM